MIRSRGASLPDVVGAGTAALILAIFLLPALASVGRSSKNGRCLTNLMQIGFANAVYSSQDPADMALPVHAMQFFQCPEKKSDGYCSDPIFVGAYEWGGKSGIGQTNNVLFPGSEDPLDSKYGTKAGFGPNTRPLNTFLYPQALADHGGLRPGFVYTPIDETGALADTKLDLPQNRCPSDMGFTGIHCQGFAESGLSSYDHFGTSYNANLFMTAASGGGAQSSNSPYLHRMSDILAPSNTLAYQENNGRFAWSAFPETCDSIAGIYGIPETVHGWHGKDWTFNAAFLDGHADTIYMRGYDNPDIGRYFENANHSLFGCIIIRGEGWQIDTLPLPRVETNLIHNGDGRPSHERCIPNPFASGERTGPNCFSGKASEQPGGVARAAR